MKKRIIMSKIKCIRHKLACLLYQTPGIDKKALNMKKSFDEVKEMLDGTVKKK